MSAMPHPLAAAATVTVASSIPTTAEVIGIPVRSSGAVPRQLGMSRSSLEVAGFDGKPGDVLAVPGNDGMVRVALGAGDGLDLAQLRTAAAGLARACGKRTSVATTLLAAAADDVAPADAAQAITEGLLLASYRYVGWKNDPASANQLADATIVAGGKLGKPATDGVARGVVTARSVRLARELANTPPNKLNARDIADRAIELAERHGLEVEVFDKDQLAVLGCGGILGVNAGSVEPPRMVKLTYAPRRPRAHVALVGKGVMYDSGGISLKPSNPSHVLMKMDMSGAAAVLSTMTALRDLGCRNKVTAWLMCTDNMPSGSATKLGDVLTIRNGKTVEVQNTDAEGRLILADGLSLAAEAEPDAIVDIATLTGAAMAALGQEYAAVIGSDQSVIDRLLASSAATDEALWQLPLARDKYRPLLDSVVADMRNVGGPYAGATTAAIFLSEFVGDVPWAHVDIAGPMNAESDNGWKSKGAIGFGTRILVDFACNFEAG